jgi:acyl-CoA thioesterase-1
VQRYLAALPAVALAVLACGPPAVPNLDSAGTTIVCLGDSITAGVGTTSSEAFPARLEAALGVPVIAAGVPGDTTAAGLRRLDRVLAMDPWLVVIELGGNDLLRRVPLETTEANLRAIAEGVLAAGVVPMLVEIEGPFGSRYDDLFERLGDELGVPVVEDVLGRVLRDRSLKNDAIQPNGAGHAEIAAVLVREIEPLVAARRAMGLGARPAAARAAEISPGAASGAGGAG